MEDFCTILKTKGFVIENLKGVIPEDYAQRKALSKEVACCASSCAPATAIVAHTTATLTRRLSSKPTATITTATLNLGADSDDAILQGLEVVGEVAESDEFLEGVGGILALDKDITADEEVCKDGSGTNEGCESLKSKIFKRSDYLGRSTVGAARRARNVAGLQDKFPLTDPLLLDFATHEKGSGTAPSNIQNMVIIFLHIFILYLKFSQKYVFHHFNVRQNEKKQE